MKNFLKYCIIFLVPVFGFLLTIETLVHTIPNSYSYKHNYVLKNGDSIEAIVLGHSQLYDGFKPEDFSLPSFNLCNSAQSYIEDYYLLKELLQYMPNLKFVILPIGYMNVKENNEAQFTERSTFYHEYMHINYDGRIPLKYRFECFNPQRAFDKIVSYYIRHIDIVGCDSVGRRSTHSLKNREHELGINSVLDDYTLKIHDKNKMRLEASEYLENIAALLQSKNIKLILVSPPHYWTGYNDVNIEQKSFLQEYIRTLSSKFHFEYINLEDDIRFKDEDYYNETHLSEFGAEKFTKILNDSIFK